MITPVKRIEHGLSLFMQIFTWVHLFRVKFKSTYRHGCNDNGTECWNDINIFLKSAWRHSVINYYDKALNTPYFAPWQLRDKLGVYRWPQWKYKRRFYKSHSRLSKIKTGNECRNIWTMQNLTNRYLIDPNKISGHGVKNRIFRRKCR